MNNDFKKYKNLFSRVLYVLSISILLTSCIGCPVTTIDTACVQDADCGMNNGSITGLSYTSTSTESVFWYEWRDTSGNVIQYDYNNRDLVGVPPGQYTFSIVYSIDTVNGDPDLSCINTQPSQTFIVGEICCNTGSCPNTNPSGIQITNADCGVSNGSIIGITIQNTTGSEVYTWTDDTGVAVGNTLELPGIAAGKYTLSISGVTGCNEVAGPFTVAEVGCVTSSCFNTDSANIQITNADCGSSNGNITGIAMQNASSSEMFTWINEVGTVVGNSIDLSGAAGGKYTLTIADGAGCTEVEGPFTIDEVGCPAVVCVNSDPSGVQITNVDCGASNGSIVGIVLQNETGNEVYTWIDAMGSSVGNALDLTMVSPGQYTLSISGSGNCTEIAGPFTIQEVGCPSNPCLNSDPSNIQITNADCGQSNGDISGIVVQNGDGNESYSWIDANGQVVGSGMDLGNQPAGEYTLIITNTSGAIEIAGPFCIEANPCSSCTITINDINVVVNDADINTANGSILGIVVNGASSVVSYEWRDAEGQVVGSSLDLIDVTKGDYILTVTANGCSLVDGPFCVQSPSDCDTDPPVQHMNIKVATVMTPNGDGANDMFMIDGLESYPNNKLYVFNRWGNKVYEASNYQNDWFGNYQNKPLPIGTYYYILEIRGAQPQTLKGSITIMK